MDKVIFLDIDGVLNSRNYYIEEHEKKNRHENFHIKNIDPKAVNRLNHIIYKTDAKIVISSTWRYGKEIDWFKWLFDKVNLRGLVIGKTPELLHNELIIPRGMEIQKYYSDKYGYPAYFEEHPSRLKSYVILDDDDDMLYQQKDNFVNTEHKFGLLDHHVPEIIKILNTELKQKYIIEE